MKKIFLGIFFVCVAAFGMVVSSGAARADLTITPTRIVFGERDRFATITLVNTGDKTRTYEMGWDFLKMQEKEPVYVTMDGPFTEFDMSQYVVFSPKRVTLAPGAKQKVRLAVKRPPVVPEGDFHIHLRFSAKPHTASPADAIDPSGAKRKSGASVDINVGYSIPVILRTGQENVKATVEQISMTRIPETGRLKVSVPVRREGGPYSILGHLFLYHIGADGKEERVGEISNAHIFAEANRRVFEVPLVKDITGGSLKVLMKSFDPKSEFVYAQQIFPLN